jgi:long-chain acyl-CoA synthetase
MYPGAHDPARTAVILTDSDRRLSYGELEERSVRLAHLLHEAGLRPGDDVALLATNDPAVFEVYWACLRSGLYLTAVNTHLSSGEAAYVVQDCDARALIVSADLAELAVDVLRKTPEVGLRLAWQGEVPGFDDYETALAGASPVPFDDQPAGADMLYSSGTTGRPKGVKPVLPARQVTEPGSPLVAVFGPAYGFTPETVYYSPAPLYHAAPLRFGFVTHALGGTVVTSKRFEPERALDIIARYRVTHSQWVPTHFVRMLRLPAEVREAADLTGLRVAIHAAAPCPVEVKAAMIRWWGPVLHEYYASTEANGITMIGPQEWLARPGSVGRAVLGVVHVCDDTGADLPAGETGLVYFERDELPFGYHKDDAKTRAAQHPRHPTWTTCGDIGRLDADGYLYLTDRQAFTIISGGVNIYPQEIEDVLITHPSVLDVAVVGIPDPEFGESVLAAVQLVDGADRGPATVQALLAHARGQLAGFKVPSRLELVDSLPRTPTGKLQKRVLRDQYAERAAPNA